MASVYQVTDLATGKQLALKQFTVPKDDKHYAESASLFEQEFSTLAQLSHPRIIEVYDYAVAQSGPFYTMELIDGGDLRERSPMPWRDACSVVYDVCSSLALIHSRRLVHRDISPRNVRCSRNGQAKLIDFGALVPMGPGGLVVGTPPFVAPEVLHRSVLDARTDLYSLGATLYYVLTGRVPYAAKTFQQLVFAWDVKPDPPSVLVDGIPKTLDALVMSMVSTDPASRPRNAFEVMQHLSAIAGLERVEPASVSRAYLSTPKMVGRDTALATVQHDMERAFGGRGRSVLVEADAGLGRSRMLDAVAIAAKAEGATVIRAHGSATVRQQFRLAASLAEQLLEAAPEIAMAAARAEGMAELLFELTAPPASGSLLPRVMVKDLAASTATRLELQKGFGRWFVAVSAKTPLAIVVDDIHGIDEPSLACLAALGSQIQKQRLLLVSTADRDATPTDRIAFDVLRRNSTRIALLPLHHGQVEALLVSVFGDVPNIRLVTDAIHAVSQGNPRATMELAQHLIDRGLVRYEGGAWTLPARLSPSDLPESAEAALAERVAGLAPLPRWLAQAQSLATHHAFTRDDYLGLRTELPAAEIDAAIGQLVSAQLVESDGRRYTIASQSARSILGSSVPAADVVAQHGALSRLYEGRLAFGVVRHALLGGQEVRALDQLAPLLSELPEMSPLVTVGDVGTAELSATFAQALAAAERLGRPPREITDLRSWLVSLGVIGEHAYFVKEAPAWLEQLKLDSGYRAWEEHAHIADPAARLATAMQLTYGRYFAMPETERVYRLDEAITTLVRYVGMSIAVASSRLDLELIESLPGLLEPFAAVNELVPIIWQNALAAREVMARVRPEHGRAMWMRDYERLGTLSGTDAKYVSLVRNGVAFGLGTCEAWMGMESATQWAERLDTDPLQRVSALQIRRSVRIQLGDWEGAEKLRKESEVLALHARSRQIFSNMLQVELNACALAGDLTALKQCIDRVRALAEEAPGWVPSLRLAEGRFQLLRGNYDSALALVESALDELEPDPDAPYPLSNVWCGAVASRAEALIGLERYEEARAVTTRALELCRKLEIRVPAHDISRALALAEAKLGLHDEAAARLAAVIEDQLELGISGLRLGANYEARARIATWAADPKTAGEYMRLTAREYRYGQGSALGARYERLFQEAYRVGGTRLPSLSEFESSGQSSGPTSATVVVTQAMKGAGGSTERAERALDLLCNERAVAVGYLYLFAPTGVRLLACRGAGAPADGVSDFVTRFLARELAEGDTATRVETAEAPEPATEAYHFTDAHGANYYPFLLRAMIGRDVRYAGVAVLAFEDRPSSPDESLVLAVATHLIQSGDTPGVEYGAWAIPSNG
jgi:tetratricopeptide (TPR) repeat protein